MNNYKEFFHRLMITLKSYIKGILILSFITFVLLSLGLLIIGIDLWYLKALAITLIDLIPILGSGAIMIPWAIIKAIGGQVNTAAYIAILYIVIVAVRFIAEPIIVGKSVGLSPLLTIGITIASVMILGPVGAIIGGFITVPIKVFWELTSGKSTISSSKSLPAPKEKAPKS